MAQGVSERELTHYFDSARSWDQERLRGIVRSRRLAWIVAAVAAGLAIAAVGAVVVLTPLKTVVPYVITVDRNTGSAEITTRLTGVEDIPAKEAVSKYFLARYVRLREGWTPAARREIFDTVAILSTPDEQKRWASFFSTDNPRSPQTLYANTTLVAVRINSIAFVNASVAQVRFVREIVSGTSIDRSNWIATLTFDYASAPLSEADRLLNPLGFQVSSYRADPEMVGPSEAAGGASSSAAREARP